MANFAPEQDLFWVKHCKPKLNQYVLCKSTYLTQWMGWTTLAHCPEKSSSNPNQTPEKWNQKVFDFSYGWIYNLFVNL